MRVLVAVVLMAGCGLGSSPRWQPDGGPGVCGDGVLDGNEACDDGNTASGDGCNAECASDESCGNGMTDVGELCDDGNTTGGDDCSSDCQSDESCGNGVVDISSGESCDDGNSVSSDGCANNCQSNESCGNQIVDTAAGEKCDPGNNVPTSTCDPDCSAPNCGDGFRNVPAGEICDTAGNTATCDSDCTLPACGDSVFNAVVGEQCDSGTSNGNGQTTCRTNCRLNVCGDLYRYIPTEACDTGGNTSSCDSDCTLPACGDGHWNPSAGNGGGEQCDAGASNGNGQVTCKTNCKLNSCGDSYRYIPTEACDTGGSSASCDGDCTAVSCGDGYTNGAAGEQCDAAASNGNGQVTCRTNCRLNVCGDSYRYIPGEACDTGGNSSTCDADCTPRVCGDGYRNSAGGEACDDGNTNNFDGCSASCQVETAVCGNGVTEAGEACDDGTNDIHGSCPACRAPYPSCRAILTAFPSATSGVYTLAGGAGQYRAFCEMTASGGGWTLAVKADGSRATFAYDDPIWETTALLSPATPDFDRVEAKLDTWNSVPFSELRVGLEYPIGSGNITWIVLPLGATRLGDLFAPGAQATTSVGRDAWKSLIPGVSSLQPNCNLEGTNVYRAYSRVRLGILGNNEADCATPDSRLGIGGGGTVCSSPTQSVGNSSCYGGDNGDVELAAFGWIMVR